MNDLKANGISPEWVQVGNETNDGMLWPGKASTNMANYAKFFIARYNAVKPQARFQTDGSSFQWIRQCLFRWNLDGLKANGAQWDVIGMSLYPRPPILEYTYGSMPFSNMNDMIKLWFWK